jgi:3-deoxy-D-manno-octulosonic-acid transferase
VCESDLRSRDGCLAPPFPLRAFCWAYDILLGISWPLFLIYYFLKSHTDGKYLASYRSRLALALPPRRPKTRRVWFHALSVGETLSVVPLIEKLKTRSPEIEIVFSTKTETAQSIARKRLSPWVSSFFYLPLDFPLVMEAIVRRLNPTVFVLVETDIWPNLLRQLGLARSYVVLVNGRISKRSFSRLRLLAPLLRPVFRCFHAVFAQTAKDKARYETLGALPDRVHAIGNLKVDSSVQQISQARIDSLRADVGIDPARLVWIAGSTHGGEEEIILPIHTALTKRYTDLLLILAPRDIRRAEDVASLCMAKGFALASRSKGQSAVGKSVYLLDTMGELSDFYAVADIAFIGGSLVPFGGHNPLEAVSKSKPTVWGPYMSNFREIEKAVIAGKCGFRIGSAQELETVVTDWLGDAPARERIRESSERFFESGRGATEEIAGFLCKILSRKNSENDSGGDTHE